MKIAAILLFTVVILMCDYSNQSSPNKSAAINAKDRNSNWKKDKRKMPSELKAIKKFVKEHQSLYKDLKSIREVIEASNEEEEASTSTSVQVDNVALERRNTFSNSTSGSTGINTPSSSVIAPSTRSARRREKLKKIKEQKSQEKIEEQKLQEKIEEQKLQEKIEEDVKKLQLN